MRSQNFQLHLLPVSQHRETHFKEHFFAFLQGQSRRVQVEVRSVPDSGTMPLIAASILSVSIGDVKVRQARPSRGGDWVRGTTGSLRDAGDIVFSSSPTLQPLFSPLAFPGGG